MQYATEPATARRDYLLQTGLFLLAAMCAATYVISELSNTHANARYLAVTYCLLLPVTIFYLRRGEDADGSARPYDLPPLHLATGAASLVIILVISVLFAQGVLIPDDTAYCFQARIFAAGKLAAPPMPGASAVAAARPSEIYFEHTIQSPGGMFTKYPPGWPALLAIGYWLHIPWLLNPLLGVAQIVCVWHLASAFGRLCQVLAISFIASSMFFIMWSTGYMSHAFASTLTLLSLMAVLKSVKESNIRWLLVAFALVIVATQVRPFTGAVIGAVCAVIALMGAREDRQRMFTTAGIVTAAAIVSVAAILLYNWTYTGDMRVSPYAALQGRRDVAEISFNLLGIADNIANTTRWGLIDTAVTTLPFLYLLAAYAVVTEKQQRLQVIALTLPFTALVLAYVIVILPSGSYNGQRYYYEGFATLSIVAARGFQLLAEHWRINRARLLTVLAVLLSLQLVRCVMGVRTMVRAGTPYVAMYDYAHNNLHTPLVFLHDSTPVFTAKHTNWNQVNWPAAPTVYLVDPGPARRDQVACRFGRPEWSVVSFDPVSRTVSSARGRAVCVGQTDSPAPPPVS